MPIDVTGGFQPKGNIKKICSELTALRTHKDGGIDISLQDLLRQKYEMKAEFSNGHVMSKFFGDIGIEPHRMTIKQLLELPDEDYHFLVPEIIREAIRTSFVQTPWYTKLIAAQETVAQPTVTMPKINLSTATPEALKQAETISEGTVSYGQKEVKISKIGIGISITDEVKDYVKLSLLAIYLQDVGARLGVKLQNNFADTLINGDQADSSESAAVIGVKTPGSKLQYVDELAVYIRMSLLNRIPNSVLTNETQANHLLNLSEHKQPYSGQVIMPAKLETPLPVNESVYVTGRVPSGQYIYLDPRFGVVQLTSRPLMIENDRNIKKQISESVATITTGFAIIHRNARVIVDETKDIAVNGFDANTWMVPVED
ncbi:MAG: hypothetical protein KBA11_07810 [Sedimentibacter sp.]|nr:hypothetical protein [Sedimentibacter sp.]